MSVRAPWRSSPPVTRINSTPSNQRNTTRHDITLLCSYCSVWGGGIFLPDVFYDTADEVGIVMVSNAGKVCIFVRIT